MDFLSPPRGPINFCSTSVLKRTFFLKSSLVCSGNVTFFHLQGYLSNFCSTSLLKRSLFSKSSLVLSGKVTYFHPQGYLNNFCSTSSLFWPLLSQKFTGPQRERHFCSQKFRGEGYLKFGAVISSTWSVITLKSIRRRAKVEHLETGSRFELIFSMVWSIVDLFQS